MLAGLSFPNPSLTETFFLFTTRMVNGPALAITAVLYLTFCNFSFMFSFRTV